MIHPSFLSCRALRCVSALAVLSAPLVLRAHDGAFECHGFAAVAASCAGHRIAAFIPEASLTLSYTRNDWTVGGTLMFDQGGTHDFVSLGTAEVSTQPAGNLDYETLWIGHTFSSAARLAVGRLVLPVGQCNVIDPDRRFSLFDDEEEALLLPCAWNQWGVSLSGEYKALRYEAVLAESHERTRIPLAMAARLDVRLSSSASLGASCYADDSLHVACLDADYTRAAWTLRAGVTLTHKDRWAYAHCIEAGYNLLHYSSRPHALTFYVHHGAYTTPQGLAAGETRALTLKHAAGLMFRPCSQVSLRAEYLHRTAPSSTHQCTLGVTYTF